MYCELSARNEKENIKAEKVLKKITVIGESECKESTSVYRVVYYGDDNNDTLIIARSTLQAVMHVDRITDAVNVKEIHIHDIEKIGGLIIDVNNGEYSIDFDCVNDDLVI